MISHYSTALIHRPVVAGLAPVSSYGLSNISLSIIPILATSYSIAFITDPRFVAKIEPVKCSGIECLSVLLPGGMESVHSTKNNQTSSSETLFSGKFPGDYSSIVVNDAPGYQLEYGSIAQADPHFQFNRSVGWDCMMFLQSIDDGLISVRGRWANC